MSFIIDTSILVAAIVEAEPFHKECAQLLDEEKIHVYSHGLTETFSTLTGGRRPFRLSAAMTTELLEEDYLPLLSVVSLSPREMVRAFGECESRGVRGGAIFDYLHLVAGRKAKVKRVYTLNRSHFEAFRGEDDPEVVHPGSGVA